MVRGRERKLAKPSGRVLGQIACYRLFGIDGPCSHRCAAVALKPSVDPQVWYFAFQEPQGIAWMWFRYGVVRKRWDETLLLNFVFMGKAQRIHPPPDADAVVVQTYLPSRLTTYRIASLHPFDASTRGAPTDDTPFVQFRQAGIP